MAPDMDIDTMLLIEELSRTVPCGNCAHTSVHCLASGCNHPDCECEDYLAAPVTEAQTQACERVRNEIKRTA